MSIAKSNNGFSFVEVLVSLVLIGVGLLGLGSMQITALKGVGSAHSRTVASMLAMDLSDRMRANTLGVQGGFYSSVVNCTTDTTACRGTTNCSPEDTAKFDLQEIMCGVKGTTRRYGGVVNLLPSGTITLSCVGGCKSANAIHDITLTWSESNIHKDSAGSTKTHSLTMSIQPN